MATQNTRHINNSMRVGNEKSQEMQWIAPKQTPTPSTMASAMPAPSALSAQNLGTRSSRLRSTSLSWTPVMNIAILLKTSQTSSQVNSRALEYCVALEMTWFCVPLGSDFRNTRTGRLTLRGLFHQKMYIMKFMAAYANVTISRWVTGRCSMAQAMHCITNHDVWSRTRDLANQSLFPLSLISSLVGTVNEEKSMSVLIVVLDGWSILSLWRSPAVSGWRGISSSCDMTLSLSLFSIERCLKRWKPPMMIKNPCVVDHCRSNNELLRMIAADKTPKYRTHLYSVWLFSEQPSIV